MVTTRPETTVSKTATLLTSFVFICSGTLLMILPWSAFWDSNHFLRLWLPLETILLNDVARIAVTGLGIIDFVLGIGEMQRFSNDSEQERSPDP